MRYGLLVWGIVAIAASPAARAELQEVTVGGKIEIYGAWYSNWFEESGAATRWPTFFLPQRPIGPTGTQSAIRSDDDGNTIDFFEQRTRLNVQACFTNSVSAFIEFDSIDTWGEDFRSNYATGADARAFSGDDVELYQAYIDVQSVYGLPLTLRIGRQELDFGSGWLVGADPGPDPFVGLSFDAIRLTYNMDPITVDAWWGKVADGGISEEDGDIDFYGVYMTFSEEGDSRTQMLHLRDAVFPVQFLYHQMRRTGPFRGRFAPTTELLTWDAYWMYVRDGASINDTNFIAPIEWLEERLSLDDYDVTELHTVGTRGAGTWNKFDWEVEAAYQWGNADSVGALFRPTNELYGDDDATWDSWGGHAEIGYTFEGAVISRLAIGGAYYGGKDNRDISFRDWINPWSRTDASVSFNRLFSSWREDSFIDASAMTNFWKAYIEAGGALTEAVTITGNVTYLEALNSFDAPTHVSFGGFRIPVAPALSFWTQRGTNDLGWQTSLWMTYAYSEDLSFEVGWSHFFVGDGIEDGTFIDSNGLAFVGGNGDEDADYVYFLTTLEF